MGFYKFFIIFICNTYLILLNVFTATADVDYIGPERVDEHSNFSITCNASPFSYIKWRLNETIYDFGVSKTDEPKSDRFTSSTVYVPSAKRTHTGRYRCSIQEDDFGHNLTVTLDDSAYSLTLTASKSIQCPASLSSNTNSTLQCAAGNLFDEFPIECAVDPKLGDDLSIAWYQGSKNRSEKETLIETNERIRVDDSTLTIRSLDVTDGRVYHCRIVKKGEQKSGTQFIRQQSVELFIAPRVPNIRRDVTGIEENPITLNCTVTTTVPVRVKWRVDNGVLKNKTFEKGDSNKYDLSGNESPLVTDGIFTIKWANSTEDRGSYTCWGESEFGKTATNMTFVLRVKGKYAALWPFIGICAEVIILCVIILIYEKKRDKTELEESDTDQGPETKSSPDHVQDNVRYRK